MLPDAARWRRCVDERSRLAGRLESLIARFHLLHARFKHNPYEYSTAGWRGLGPEMWIVRKNEAVQLSVTVGGSILKRVVTSSHTTPGTPLSTYGSPRKNKVYFRWGWDVENRLLQFWMQLLRKVGKAKGWKLPQTLRQEQSNRQKAESAGHISDSGLPTMRGYLLAKGRTTCRRWTKGRWRGVRDEQPRSAGGWGRVQNTGGSWRVEGRVDTRAILRFQFCSRQDMAVP